MKQKHKDMLFGYIAGQSQGRLKNNDSPLSAFEWFKVLWIFIFSASVIILISLIAFMLAEETYFNNFLSIYFEGVTF